MSSENNKNKMEFPKKSPQNKSLDDKGVTSEIESDVLKKLINSKDLLTIEGKEKLLKLLKYIKDGKLKVCDTNKDDIKENDIGTERNPVAKVENTKGNLESYASQKQRIQFTDKELQSIIGFKDRSQPIEQDKFMVKYQSSDPEGNNTTTIIQKEREGQLFNFVAYAKKEGSKGKETSNSGSDDNETPDFGSLKEDANSLEDNQISIEDDIVITKSITFSNDTESSDILSDFLRAIEI